MSELIGMPKLPSGRMEAPRPKSKNPNHIIIETQPQPQGGNARQQFVDNASMFEIA